MKVLKIRHLAQTKTTPVYDIEVRNNHNFFAAFDGGVPVLTHNCHKASADEFAKIVNTVSTKHRYGLTGTPARKDGRYFLTEMIVGPVVHKTEVESLVPTIKFTESGFTRQYKDWNAFITALAKDESRNQLIVDLTLFYLQQGHTIVIPVYRIGQVATLVKMINNQYGKKIAVPFTGQLKKEQRRQTVLDMRKGKYKVLVGIRSITQTGLNIPALSCILEVAPISNPPQHTQECSRILTPVPDKIPTIIHYLVDLNGIGLGCLRNCVLNTHKALGHHITKKNWGRLSEWFKLLRRNDDAFKDADSPVKSEHGRRPALAKAESKRTRGLFSKEKS